MIGFSCKMSLYAVPLTQKQANEFVAALHRHHKPSRGDKYRIGAAVDGRLVGIVQVGRPVARGLDDGLTVEVTRLCTDGTPHACSFLYGAAARVAKELGFHKIVTYILASEPGTSLKASGWQFDGIVRGRNWSCPSRPRNTCAPTEDKQRYIKVLRE